MEWDGYVDAADGPEEWSGEGLPPAGTECIFNRPGDKSYECEVIGYDGYLAVCAMPEEYPCQDYVAIDPLRLSPLRTKEQRDREELLLFLQGNWLQLDKAEIVDAIIAAGWRKGE